MFTLTKEKMKKLDALPRTSRAKRIKQKEYYESFREAAEDIAGTDYVSLKLIRRLYDECEDYEIERFCSVVLRKPIAKKVLFTVATIFDDLIEQEEQHIIPWPGYDRACASACKKAASVVYEALKDDKNWKVKARKICKGR